MATCNSNGIITRLEIERRDWIKIAALIVAVLSLILGTTVPLTTHIFQTRTQAIIEHAEIKQSAAVQAIELEQIGEKAQEVAIEVKKTQRVLYTLDANQRELMRNLEIPSRRIKKLPSDLNFDFEEPEE